MPLSIISTLLKEVSGRYDLFDESGNLTTTGLFYVNAGSRFLDRLALVGKMRAKYPVEIVQDSYITTFGYARAIEKVWIQDDDGEKELDLDTYALPALRAKYSAPIADLERGKPQYAALNIIRLAPGGSVPVGIPKAGDIVADDSAIDGIIYYPPADQTYYLIIQGLFYSGVLSLAADKNIWTERYPDLLLQAVNYKLEVFLRNREGMLDWLESLRIEAMQVTSDYAWEGIGAETLQMEA